MSMFNDISWGSKRQQERMQVKCSTRSLSMQQDNGHSSDLDQRKSGILSVKTVHKENGTKLQRK